MLKSVREAFRRAAALHRRVEAIKRLGRMQERRKHLDDLQALREGRAFVVLVSPAPFDRFLQFGECPLSATPIPMIVRKPDFEDTAPAVRRVEA